MRLTHPSPIGHFFLSVTVSGASLSKMYAIPFTVDPDFSSLLTDLLQVLRRCEPGRVRDDYFGHERIFTSTAGIIFLGTPHRGGNYGTLGKAVESIVKRLGFDTYGEILRELDQNGPVLSLLQEEFLRVLEKKGPSLAIYSFQEGHGLARIQGLHKKVRGI